MNRQVYRGVELLDQLVLLVAPLSFWDECSLTRSLG